MNRCILLFALIALGCESKKEYLIQVPEKTRITSEYILSELEEKAKEEPENEWLLNQQLYFCEQLGWPARCERPLRKAREKFGLSERLIDRFVAFYLAQESYVELGQILQGAVETRGRLEALIKVSIHQDSADLTYLNRYLERFNDATAFRIGAESYLHIKDTMNAVAQIRKLKELDVTNKYLSEVYPFLLNDHAQDAIQIINYQLREDSLNQSMIFDLALAYNEIDRTDTAKMLLKKVGTPESFTLLHDWYKNEKSIDSALLYLRKVGDYSQDKALQLSHAELLELKGFITLSLPYFETALALDTTDIELQKRVEIVRRKVAYLRNKREQEALPAPPKVEKKTLGN
jgi:hypothetical protein